MTNEAREKGLRRRRTRDIIKVFTLMVLVLSVLGLQGCGKESLSDPSGDPAGAAGPTGSAAPKESVTIQRINETYYRVDIDMSAGSHYEIGRQYALQIKNSVPDFELLVDSALSATLFATLTGPSGLIANVAFGELTRRAKAIYANILPDYQQEIQGMQSVFSGTDDTVGNGRVSQNKLLVWALAPDVARLDSCSASAAFGSGTASGKTIIGRNLDWYDNTVPYLSALETAAIFHNGSKSVVIFGFLGQLFPLTGFNTSKVFVATMDSDVLVPYRLLGGETSYVMDLRQALENEVSLEGVANYMAGRKYAYGFNIFLADESHSAVFEKDVVTPFSGLRTATSVLKKNTVIPISPWNFSNAISCVNWYTLPGTADNTYLWLGNPARWNALIDHYTSALANGNTMTIDVMKQIMGYSGPNGNGQGEEGAIWRYDNIDSTMQSIVMDMDTFETWVSFRPAGPSMKAPNYVQIFSGDPFQADLKTSSSLQAAFRYLHHTGRRLFGAALALVGKPD
jgi:hypothetical protein